MESQTHSAVIDLSRRVRFFINPQPNPRPASRTQSESSADGGANTFAAWPTLSGMGTFYELEVVCRGEIDPVTGYFMNISEIDQAVRTHAIPVVAQAHEYDPTSDPGALLLKVIEAIQPALQHSVRSIRWCFSPYHSFEMSTPAPQRVIVREQFEFAAAHRLHCRSMSAAENQSVFGKCNNPNGHGHNYRLEVAVARDVDQELDLATLESVVRKNVVDRFDHKHLNQDLEEFAERNPSVEHIARVAYDLLREEIAGIGGDLVHVTVWETEKTSCTYPAR